MKKNNLYLHTLYPRKLFHTKTRFLKMLRIFHEKKRKKSWRVYLISWIRQLHHIIYFKDKTCLTMHFKGTAS